MNFWPWDPPFRVLHLPRSFLPIGCTSHSICFLPPLFQAWPRGFLPSDAPRPTLKQVSPAHLPQRQGWDGCPGAPFNTCTVLSPPGSLLGLVGVPLGEVSHCQLLLCSPSQHVPHSHSPAFSLGGHSGSQSFGHMEPRHLCCKPHEIHLVVLGWHPLMTACSCGHVEGMVAHSLMPSPCWVAHLFIWLGIGSGTDLWLGPNQRDMMGAGPRGF